jgi:adenylosuccinate lyase
MWLYISRGIFKQKVNENEVGSSTMPHKVNPIYFENAEGNAGMANALFNHLAQTLPISRMQRDLSGSTIIRNQGVALAHSFLTVKNIRKGLERVEPDTSRLENELNEHWEILAEAVQTVLRKYGRENAYDEIKRLTHGIQLNETTYTQLVDKLGIPSGEKKKLLALTPFIYLGQCSNLSAL